MLNQRWNKTERTKSQRRSKSDEIEGYLLRDFHNIYIRIFLPLFKEHLNTGLPITIVNEWMQIDMKENKHIFIFLIINTYKQKQYGGGGEGHIDSSIM